MTAPGSTDDLRRSLVDAPGLDAYPIASFTWMLLDPVRIGDAKSRQLVEFLRWALVDGGSMASALGYVALPTATAERVLDLLDSSAVLKSHRP
jgi:phosphate transport system substrate-binding protein